MDTFINFDLLSSYNNNIKDSGPELDNNFLGNTQLISIAEESLAVEALSQLTSDHHIDLTLTSCQLCGIKYGTTADLLNHHEAICGDGIYTNTTPATTSKTLINEQLIYVQQQEQTSTNSELSNDNQCDICGVIFTRPSSLANHIKVHNYQPGRVVNKNIKTTVDYYFGSLNADGGSATTTVTLNNENSILNDDGNSFLHCNVDSSDKKLYRRCNTIDNLYQCTKCDKKFTTRQKLQRHIWIHRKLTTVKCKICLNQFDNNETMNAHLIQVHRQSTGECDQGLSGSSMHGGDYAGAVAPYDCKVCGKTFTSRQGYLIHTRIHTDQRPYGCRFCWKAFRDGGTLRKHERIHTGERPHTCPLCSKTFNQKVMLREHVRWLHAANTPANAHGLFDCPICDVVGSDRDDFCVHIIWHSDQRGRTGL